MSEKYSTQQAKRNNSSPCCRVLLFLCRGHWSLVSFCLCRCTFLSLFLSLSHHGSAVLYMFLKLIRCVCMRVFVCMYLCENLYIYLHAYINVCMYIYAYINVYLYIFIYIYLSIYIFLYIYLSIYIYITWHILHIPRIPTQPNIVGYIRDSVVSREFR